VPGELALDLGADAEGGRILSEALGEIPLQILELPEKPVVLGVRQSRAVENVVLVRGAIEDDAQLGRATKLRLSERLLRL